MGASTTVQDGFMGIINIYSNLDTMINSIIDGAEFLLSPVLLILLIGAFVHLIFLFAKPLMEGREIPMGGLLKPFFLYILLSLYSPIMSAVNAGFNVLSEEVEIAVDRGKMDLSYQEKIYKKSILDHAKKSSDITDEEDRAVDEAVTNSSNPESYKKKLSDMKMERKAERKWYDIAGKIEDALFSMTMGVASVCKYLLLLVRAVVLSFLILFAPFSIAFSAFTGYSSALRSIFAKLIGVYMWLPIAHVFDLVFNHMFGMIFASTDGGLYNVQIMLWSAIIMICTYFSIPKLAGWIIPEGGGDGGILAPVKQATAITASVAMMGYGKLFGVLAGATSGASSGGNTSQSAPTIGSGGTKS